MLWKYTLLWLVLAILAIANGTVRNQFYADILGDLRAHQLSAVTLIVLIAAATWVFNLIWKLESARQALLIGAVWLALTVIFEFGFGHFVMGHPWSKLFFDYNIFAGRIWILILIWTLLAPLTVRAVRP